MLGPIELIGRENIPTSGAYLVVFNHVSLYDAPLLLAIWPGALEALGAQDIWGRPGQNILVKSYGAIPILRGEVDREAATRVLAALRSGRPVMMAPEGGRSHGRGMAQGKSGVVYFIEATGVQVLPVGVVGTKDDYYQQGSRGLRPEVKVIVGKAFDLPTELGANAASPREVRQMKVDFIMCRIADLLPEEYQGYYKSECAGEGTNHNRQLNNPAL
ncbi:MAG: 1-acyl-sn-glycerol-3-phosphate acyltransferase [Anaerolineaceae bacterium]|nr:1-acyl-sn-glycerol-3-phosphate acyltransferase [Anaerolineaceae bacterium]MBN2676436.1 1-acyl-sn-glycerol-3-phosphate acyltransferase [Anaerolineaceae bacterium]